MSLPLLFAGPSTGTILAPTNLQVSGTPTFFGVTLTWTDPIIPHVTLGQILVFQNQDGTWVNVYAVAPGEGTVSIYPGDTTSAFPFEVTSTPSGFNGTGGQFYVRAEDTASKLYGEAFITVTPVLITGQILSLNMLPGVASSDFSDSPPGTTSCNIGDAIQTASGDPYGLANYASQGASGNRPIQQSIGAQYSGPTDSLSLSAPISLASAQDFGFYWWGDVGASGTVIPMLANSGDISDPVGFLIFSDGNIYFQDGVFNLFGGSFGGFTGPVLIRFRSRGGNVFLQWTSQSEINGGGWNGLPIFNSIGLTASTFFNNDASGGTAGTIFVVGDDPTETGDDALIRAFIAAQGGYAL